MSIVFRLAVLLFGYGTSNAWDTNRVTPSCAPEEATCEFHFRISHNITMTLWHSQEQMWPVVQRGDGQLVARLKDCTERNLTKREAQSMLSADGSHIRAMLINGQLPGPPIVVYEGQQVAVRVKNELENEVTTLHWHGIHQRLTPWMDGAGTVSQCPIQPGESFTYRFVATPPGSHWYHAHFGTQRTMGLHGPIAVLPRTLQDRNKHRGNDSLPVFEKDFFMVVNDWMNKTSYEIFHRAEHELLTMPDLDQSEGCYHPTRQMDGVELGITPFFSALINGKGHHLDNWSHTIKVDSPLEVFHVRRGDKVHFRLISASMLYPFRVSIDHHDIHVIASDAHDVITMSVESVIIQSGERYDFWVDARDPAVEGNYWIRVQTVEYYNTTQRMSPGEVRAILRYDGAPDGFPSTNRRVCSSAHPCTVLNCPSRYYPLGTHIYCLSLTDLRHPSLQPTPTSGTTEHRSFKEHFLNFSFRGKGTLGAFHPTINGVVHVPHTQPPQLYPLRDVATCDSCRNQDVCLCTHQIEAPLKHIIQLVFYVRTPKLDPNGMTGTSHPIHLHGHSFQVVKIGWPTYNRTSGLFVENSPDIQCVGTGGSCNEIRWRNTSWAGGNVPGVISHGAPRKDTVNVPAGGYVVIRFVADNPGFWFLHCHVEFHNEMGMALVLKEGEATDMTVPPKNMPRCGNFEWSRAEFEKKLQFPHGTNAFVVLPTDESPEEKIQKLTYVSVGLACTTFVLGLAAASVYLWYRPRPQPIDAQFSVEYTPLTGSMHGSSQSNGSLTTTRSLSNSLAT